MVTSTVGSGYRLLPQYIEAILDGEYPSYAVEPVYHVASNTLPLALDQSVQGFRGIIPNITSGFQVLKPLPRLENVSQSGKTRAGYICKSHCHCDKILPRKCLVRASFSIQNSTGNNTKVTEP